MDRLEEIKLRLDKVPDCWDVSSYLASVSLNHIESGKEGYWKRFDEHVEFIKHAASDMRYLVNMISKS